MVKVHIPATIEAATKKLDGLGALLTAKEWERAAIVYAFTTDEIGGGPRTAVKSPQLSCRQFAELGISGLKSDQTVRVYRNAWQSAIDDGQAQPVRPGDDVELPAIPWPPTAHERGRIDMARASAPPEEKAEIIRQLVTEDSKVAEIVAHDPVIARSVSDARARTEEPREAVAYSAPAPDYRGDLVRGVGLITNVIRAIRLGDFELRASEELLLHALSVLIEQSQRSEPDADLFADIDQHLREGSVK